MTSKETVCALWPSIRQKAWHKPGNYFTQAAVINWHTSNKQFTPAEFARVNCEYSGD